MKHHLKALIVVIVLASVGIWIFQSYFLSNLREGNSSIRSLDEMELDGAPNFIAHDLKDERFELKNHQGKVVILNFWASWCAPCIEEVPSLIKLASQFKSELHLVAISGDSSREDIDIFLKSFPGLKAENISIIWDKDRTIMKQFSVARLPESYILDKSQKLTKKIAGSIDWHTEESVAFLNLMIKK
jgi:cytochrome c biogenesis protein CcmG/thiol:disulfide interchange protein DsbE